MPETKTKIHPYAQILLDVANSHILPKRQLSLEACGHETVFRGLKKGQEPKLSTLEKICDALGLEFYIGPRRDIHFSVSDIPPDVAKDMNHACIKQAVVLTEKIVAKIKTPVTPEQKANTINKIYDRLWSRRVARFIDRQKPDAAKHEEAEHFDDGVIEIVQDIISDLLLEAA